MGKNYLEWMRCDGPWQQHHHQSLMFILTWVFELFQILQLMEAKDVKSLNDKETRIFLLFTKGSPIRFLDHKIKSLFDQTSSNTW